MRIPGGGGAPATTAAASEVGGEGKKGLQPHPDRRRRQVQDGILYPVWAVRIPSYALRVNKCTGYLPGLHERLLRPYIDDFVVCCLDDRLIYVTNEKEHDEYIRRVLQRVRKFGHYCKS